MNGAERIAAERQRQIVVEGYTPEHDAEHDDGEILSAARCYLEAAWVIAQAPRSELAVVRYMERNGADPATDDDLRRMREHPVRYYYGYRPPQQWPWGDDWNPSTDAICNLARAGALIAAEIDRLLAVL